MHKESHIFFLVLAIATLFGGIGLLLPMPMLSSRPWILLCAALLLSTLLLYLSHRNIRLRMQALSARANISEKRLRALRVAMERSPTSILVTDTQGMIEYANPTICAFTGYSINELLGKSSSIFNSGKTPRETHLDLWQTLARGENWNGRFISKTKSGTLYLEQTWIAPVYDEENQLANYVAVKLDITEQVRTLSRERLHNRVLDMLSRNRSPSRIFKTIINAFEQENEHLRCAIFLRSEDGTELLLETALGLPFFLQQAFAKINIEQQESVISRAAFEARRIISNALHKQSSPLEDTLIRAGIQSCWGEPIFDINNQVNGVLAFFSEHAGEPSNKEINLTEHAASLVRLVIERSHNTALLKLAETVYQTSSEAMAVTDANGTFIHINPAFTKITGYTADEAIGKNHALLKSGRHDASFYQKMWGSLNETGQWQGEIWNKRKSGEIYPQLLSINSTYNADGNVKFRISLFADISKQKANEELIWRQANFDTLTGLANRRYFQEVFQYSLRLAQREQQQLAIIFIDLDDFKPVNDRFGHQFGDTLLTQAAKRIKIPLRETDIVARIGGDEFIILLGGNPSADDALLIAQRIHKQLLEPFKINGQSASISLSCGISLYPEHGHNQEQLIKHADMAMYQAKSAGRNQTVFYEPPATTTPEPPAAQDQPAPVQKAAGARNTEYR